MEADICLYTETVLQSEIKTHIAEYAEEDSELNTDPYMFEKLVIVKDGNEERNTDIHMEADIGLYTETVIQSEIKTHIADYEEDSELNTDPYMFEKLVIVKDGNGERNTDIPVEVDTDLYTERIIQSEIKTQVVEYADENISPDANENMKRKVETNGDSKVKANTEDINSITERNVREIQDNTEEPMAGDVEANFDMHIKNEPWYPPTGKYTRGYNSRY